MRRIASVFAAVSALTVLISCSGTTTSSAPEKGTPAFYWSAAKETYAAGDYMKTIDHLGKLTTPGNEYAKRAQPWLLVLTSGMSRGYADMADAFEYGARNNKQNPLVFRRQVSVYRGYAAKLAVQFAESFQTMQQNSDEKIPFDFAYPSGGAAQVPLLLKVGTGIEAPETELEAAQKAALKRGVLLETCAASGAPDDPARTSEMFKAGNVQIARPVFVMSMAASLHEASKLFTKTKLDDPAKLKALCGRAQEAVKSLPDSKEKKELDAKISATLKKA